MTQNCPKCGEPLNVSLRKRAASWPLIIVGLVFAVPTVGISLIATVYGVFMRVPACGCTARIEASSPPR